MFKHWKNITIYKLSREADLTHLEDKKENDPFHAMR